MKDFVWALLLIVAGHSSVSASTDSLDSYLAQIQAIAGAGLYLDSAKGIKTVRPTTALVPASSLKLLTAYLALKKWGPAHRFETHFYQSGQCLWVKGLGDPYLTSEELERIGHALAQKIALESLNCIGIDSSFFPDLRLAGRGHSDNPYDAGNSAFAVNFNSFLVKSSAGQLISAEQQTPISPLVSRVVGSMNLTIGATAKRISLPGGQAQSAQYAAEVLSLIVFKKLLPIEHGSLPVDRQPLYQHRNSNDLAEVLRLMLKYSNNYIANQLYLLLPERSCQAPVSALASANYYRQQIDQQFGWQDYAIADGAGLSRDNRVSVQQLAQLLEVLRPWRSLLVSYPGDVFAKTGTMSDISSMAGYYQDKVGRWRVFAFIANDFGDHSLRQRLIQSLPR